MPEEDLDNDAILTFTSFEFIFRLSSYTSTLHNVFADKGKAVPVRNELSTTP
jgi:hypothetical protein